MNFQKARKVVKSLGVQKVVIGLVKIIAFFKPNWIVNRDGIRYSLDLRKLIDREILFGGWEQNTINFIDKNLIPNNTVIEVGANIGAHTLIMAKKVGSNGRIVAIEPTSYALSKLRNNIELNNFSQNITVIDSLISDDEIELNNVEINSDWGTDGRQSPEKVSKTTTTIDSLVSSLSITGIDLLKVDVDGFDYKVLKGSVNSLKNFRPIVFCELCEYALKAQGDSISDIFLLMCGLGYEAFSEIDGGPLSLEAALDFVGIDTSINAVFRYAQS